MTSVIDKPLKRFRVGPTKGGEPKVVRDGGKYGAGLIKDVSIITRGEALGHHQWVDQFAVEGVAAMGNKTRNGVKARFTHPSLSADGLGTMLGRFKNFRVRDGQAIADLHFQRSSHEAPDGDLAKYVMDMADEDPEALATSIVFDPDFGEMDRFTAQHEDEDGNFNSPDDDNTNNFEHMRLSRLWATDVVDDPAANPGGLFRKGHEVAEEADRLCEFALGLSEERPTLQHLSADADRLAQYAARFLESHNLEIKEKSMSTEPRCKNDAAPSGITLEQLNSFGETLLSKVDEKLAASGKAKEQQATQPTIEEIEKRGAERLQKLTAIAHTAGLNDHEKIGKGWFDKGLTPELASAAVEPLLIGQNQLTKDSGEQASDPEAKYKKEYNAQRAAFTAMGLTEKEYITSRKIDDGAELLAPKQAEAA